MNMDMVILLEIDLRFIEYSASMHFTTLGENQPSYLADGQRYFF